MTISQSGNNWLQSRIYWVIAIASIIAFFILEIFPFNVAQWIFAIIGIIFAILFFIFYSRSSLKSKRWLNNQNNSNNSNNNCIPPPSNIDNQIQNAANSPCTVLGKGKDEVDDVLNNMS